MNGGPLFSGILDKACTPIGFIQLGVAPPVKQLGGAISPAGATHFWQSGKTLNASITPAGAISKGMVLGTSRFAAGLSFTGAVSKGMVLGRNIFAAGIAPSGAITMQPFHTYVSMTLLATLRKFKFSTMGRMFNFLAPTRKLTLTVLDSGRASLLTNPTYLDVASTEVVQITVDLTAALVPGEIVIDSPAPSVTIFDANNTNVVVFQGSLYGANKYGSFLYGGPAVSGSTTLTFNINGRNLAIGRSYLASITVYTSVAKKITILTKINMVA